MEDSQRFYDDYVDNLWKIYGESIVYICIYNGELMDNLCAIYVESMEVYQLEFIVLKKQRADDMWRNDGDFVDNLQKIHGDLVERLWKIDGESVLITWRFD